MGAELTSLIDYDDLIENNTRRIEILELMAQMLYREWFVNFRFPGYEKNDGVEAEMIGRPKSWRTVSFNEIAEFINGFAFGPDHWRKNGRPIIKIKELKNGVTPDTPRYDGGFDEKYLVRAGEILFSWSADLDVYIWAREESLLNQHLFRVLPKNGFGAAFIFLSLKNQMQSFRSLSMGTTMRHIKRSALNEVQVLAPDEPILRRFESVVTPLISLVTNLSQKKFCLQQTRDLLLPKLISGEVSVERIEAELSAQMV